MHVGSAEKAEAETPFTIYYNERQKYFDVHYKASGGMRTDLQRKLMLRIANPAQ